MPVMWILGFSLSRPTNSNPERSLEPPNGFTSSSRSYKNRERANQADHRHRAEQVSGQKLGAGILPGAHSSVSPGAGCFHLLDISWGHGPATAPPAPQIL